MPLHFEVKSIGDPYNPLCTVLAHGTLVRMGRTWFLGSSFGVLVGVASWVYAVSLALVNPYKELAVRVPRDLEQIRVLDRGCLAEQWIQLWVCSRQSRLRSEPRPQGKREVFKR